MRSQSLTAGARAETVAAYMAVQVSPDAQYPIWTLRYSGTRGTVRSSECRFNDAAGALRHGAQLVGLVMR